METLSVVNGLPDARASNDGNQQKPSKELHKEGAEDLSSKPWLAGR